MRITFRSYRERLSGGEHGGQNLRGGVGLQVEGAEVGEDLGEVGSREHWRISCGGMADDNPARGASGETSLVGANARPLSARLPRSPRAEPRSQSGDPSLR